MISNLLNSFKIKPYEEYIDNKPVFFMTTFKKEIKEKFGSIKEACEWAKNSWGRAWQGSEKRIYEDCELYRLKNVNYPQICDSLELDDEFCNWCYAEDYKVPDGIAYFSCDSDDARLPTKRTEDAGYDIYAHFDEDYIMIPPMKSMLVPTGIRSAISDKYVFILKEKSSTGKYNIALRSGVIDSGYRGEWLVCLANLSDVNLYITKIPRAEVLKDVIDKEVKEAAEHGTVPDAPHIHLPTEDGIVVYNIARWNTHQERNGIFWDYNKSICQAVLQEVPKVGVKEISKGILDLISSERKDGKMGSTNK